MVTDEFPDSQFIDLYANCFISMIMQSNHMRKRMFFNEGNKKTLLNSAFLI